MSQEFEALYDRVQNRKNHMKQNKRAIMIRAMAIGGFLLLLLILVFAFRSAGEEPAPPAAPVAETTVPTEPETIPTTAPTVPETQPPTETVPETVPETTEAVTRERIHYDLVPMYFQTDYPNDRFGRGTIESHGCGITCLAMVASYLTGHEYLPDELADYFGGYGLNNIQKLEHGSDMLQLPWKKAKNVHEVIRAVQSGSVAILMMNEESMFTQGEHFIVVGGVNDEGLYLINDPYEPNYEMWGLKQGFETGFEEFYLVKGYSGGWIYDVSAMPEEPFIYEEIKPYVEPRYPDIQLTPEEELLLAKVIWIEARGECAEGQQAIAEVVFNRIMAEGYPDTVYGVLHYDNQFDAIDHLEKAEPTQAQYDAIEDALTGPYILPLDVLHFATYPLNSEVWGTIGGHTFCYRWGTKPTEPLPEETLAEETVPAETETN